MSISIGNIVFLISDPSKRGPVVDIDGNIYTVWLDGMPQTFFVEQIQLYVPPTQKSLSLKQVRAALTAYQIQNPSSSNLYSLNAARIDFVPYQFRPALKLIRSDAARILIADDVGVGKTIEAGLILKELEARFQIESVLIICPKPLVAERKWEIEMHDRFDEKFSTPDGNLLRQCISDTDRDGDWPTGYSKAIIPYSLLENKENITALGKLDPLPHFDLVIVDEAHNIRTSKTQRYQGVELFCQNADAVIFMTATPLQNSNKDLYTLLHLLRPDVVSDKPTFFAMIEPNIHVNKLARIVRNQQSDWREQGKLVLEKILATPWGNDVIRSNPAFKDVESFFDKAEVTRDEKVAVISKIEALHSFDSMLNRTRRMDIDAFCKRQPETVRPAFSASQKALYNHLMAFESSALLVKNQSVNIRFMMCTIMRQAASCIHGLKPFMEDMIADRLFQISAQISDCALEQERDFTIDGNELKTSFLELAMKIIDLSEQLTEADPKFDELMKIVRKKQDSDNNKIILFSSFLRTLDYLCERLQAEGLRVARIDGSVDDDVRFELRQRFMKDRAEDDALDMLLFSEVGSEGLDYQFCDMMINYDLPWNPMRIEQRIGRIDRRGQKSDAVQIFNLITKDTIDEDIYDRCLSKIGVFEASIGDCSEILGEISEKITDIMLKAGLTAEDRAKKIEQLADNKIRELNELRRLEKEQRQFFGLDLSSELENKLAADVKKQWIQPKTVRELAEIFLEDFLGTGGELTVGNLKLAAEKKFKLLNDPKRPQKNAGDYKRWQSYLKSGNPNLSITFDIEQAKKNLDVTFLTSMHPFIVQAARNESGDEKFPLTLAVETSREDIAKGAHEFLIYSWNYDGIRSDIELIPIAENASVEKDIISIMLNATSEATLEGNHDDNWRALEELHGERWREARDKYIDDVREDCQYRVEQLTHLHNKRIEVLQAELAAASNAQIRRMKSSQLDNAKRRHTELIARVEAKSDTVDLKFRLLLRGVLFVR